MKAIVKYLFILFSIVYLAYLSLPSPEFPTPPPNSVQSQEPADTESPLRHAYFTDYTREEVLTWYKNQFNYSPFMELAPLPTYRLNYPPEEAYGIIRDQTRSTFLEEIVHPFRESLFINGFEPKVEKDAINIDGKKWRQKITVRWVPSSVYSRILVGILTIFCVWFIYLSFISLIHKLKIQSAKFKIITKNSKF
jgi:hypothetical protein